MGAGAVELGRRSVAGPIRHGNEHGAQVQLEEHAVGGAQRERALRARPTECHASDLAHGIQEPAEGLQVALPAGEVEPHDLSARRGELRAVVLGHLRHDEGEKVRSGRVPLQRLVGERGLRADGRVGQAHVSGEVETAVGPEAREAQAVAVRKREEDDVAPRGCGERRRRPRKLEGPGHVTIAAGHEAEALHVHGEEDAGLQGRQALLRVQARGLVVDGREPALPHGGCHG
mmetsp:Transcript_8366/g.28453  ORF Transcript_8366/g.28453 Transcript_8366/m.28453 type:complete len:231 (-) Transcript_8366:28-720(-)